MSGTSTAAGIGSFSGGCRYRAKSSSSAGSAPRLRRSKIQPCVRFAEGTGDTSVRESIDDEVYSIPCRATYRTPREKALPPVRPHPLLQCLRPSAARRCEEARRTIKQHGLLAATRVNLRRRSYEAT